MLRTTPNSVKDTKAILQDYKKQQSQPTVNVPDNATNFFHIPQKYQQSRAKLSFKPQMTTSKSIEEKRYKVNKNNFSECNNRTNSSSKSRLVQVDEDSLSSQNALKLKKIIGESTILNTQILKQLSKQNLTCDSQSPGLRQNKSSYKKSTELDQSQLSLLKEKTLLHKKTQSLSVNKQKELIDSLWTLDRSIQGSLTEQLKKQYYLKSRGLWDQFKEGFTKQFAKIPMQYRQQFNQLTIQVKEIEQQWAEILVSIANNLFDIICNSAVLMACEQDARLQEMLEQMRRERDIWQNNCKQVEQERDILLETVQQLKQTVESLQPNQTKPTKDLESMDTIQLKEMSQVMQQKIQEMSEKEAKLIKLVLAIRRSGVDIEKIYNEEVLNDDSADEQGQSSLKKSQQFTPYERSVHDADNSVVNDSDESSFCFKGRLDNESIIESIRRFENRNVNYLQDSKNTVKLKLDLSKCQTQTVKQQQQQHHQQQQLQQQQQQLLQQQQQQAQQQKLVKLKIPDAQDNIGFHQEFMMKFNEFSESWRVQALKDERRTKS